MHTDHVTSTDRDNPAHRVAALALAGMMNANVIERRRAATEGPYTVECILAAATIKNGRMWVAGTYSVPVGD